MNLPIGRVTSTAANPTLRSSTRSRPGMATIPGAMLLCASSPHARKGALWSAFSKHYGKDGDPILVWRAATREMNPAVPRASSTCTWPRIQRVRPLNIWRSFAPISKLSCSARWLKAVLAVLRAGTGCQHALPRFRRCRWRQWWRQFCRGDQPSRGRSHYHRLCA